MPQMDESAFKAVLGAKIQEAKDFVDGEDISNRQEKAIKYYLKEPLGTEREGRSQVIMSEVKDTMGWAHPAVLRPFVISERIVEFTPVEAEDEKAALQETDVVNYVFQKQNNGFLRLFEFTKDGLFPKGGFIKVVWEDKEKETIEPYRNLSDDEFEALKRDAELELIEEDHEVEQVDILQTTSETGVDVREVDLSEISKEERETLLLQGAQLGKVRRHHAKFRKVQVKGQVRVLNIPPENMLVSPHSTWNNIKEIPLIGEITEKTITDLIEDGLVTKEQAESLQGFSTFASTDDDEELARDRGDTQTGRHDEDDVDPAMRQIEVVDIYVKVDYDGDGKAELRKVVMAGNDILENEEVESNPYSYICSDPLTHRFFGSSFADDTMDMQEIGSTVFRQILDNLYLSNNQQVAANENTVDISALLKRRVGDVIQVDGQPGTEIAPIPYTPMPPQAFGLLDLLDKIVQQRTGVDKGESTLNPDALKQMNIPAARTLFEARTAKTEMIARLFAETGIKQIFLDIHALLRKFQDKEMTVNLRNGFEQVDPREWRERTDMTISIGFGTGSSDAQLVAISEILNDQKEAIANGGLDQIVTLQNVYNALRRKTELAGFKGVDEFWQDPEQAQPQEEEPPDPQILLAQKTVELEAQRQQSQQQIDSLKIQLDTEKVKAELQLEQVKLQQKQQELDRKERELEAKTEKGLQDVITDRNKQELESGQNVPGAGV